MNKETLLKGLNDKLKGKQIETGGAFTYEYQIRGAVAEILKEEGVGEWRLKNYVAYSI